jgi:hypothetical protein
LRKNDADDLRNAAIAETDFDTNAGAEISMAKRKDMVVWHIVEWIHSDEYADGMAVGDVVGYEERTSERWEYDREKKGFFIKTKLSVLGILPADYHIKYPEEARARIDLWKKRFIEINKYGVNHGDQ